MSDNNNIMNELQEMGSPLAGMPRQMPYAVPDGYFSAKVTIPYTTPLPGSTEMPYTVPAGYFEEMTGRTMAAVKQEARGKRTVQFVPKMQWLQAAALALIITIGGYIMVNSQPTQPYNMLASISKAEISAYMEQAEGQPEPTIDGEVIKTLQIDNKDIVAYLNDTGWE